MPKTNSKKELELSIVKRAAGLLNEHWVAKCRETPDFEIDCLTQTFGFEVTQVFAGSISKRRGSGEKRQEIDNQSWMDCLRREYESHSSVSLHVRYSGRKSNKVRSEILRALLAQDFLSQNIPLPTRVRLDEGVLFFNKEFVSNWYFLKDQVGWVSKENNIIQKAIDSKAEKLQQYRQCYRDMRLLVFAEPKWNSGKIQLNLEQSINRQGFEVVYFLSYPYELLKYSQHGCQRYSVNQIR